jgi:hypothetical protein
MSELRVDRVKCIRESLGVARDDGLAKVGLTWEVIVEAGLRNGKLSCHVRIAEAVEASDLDESFADIQDARARTHSLAVGIDFRATHWDRHAGQLDIDRAGAKLGVRRDAVEALHEFSNPSPELLALLECLDKQKTGGQFSCGTS